jgi:hypothetical protein
MWRRTYLALVLVRLWFACSPSYLHPDENFQGPEVIAGTFLAIIHCFNSVGRRLAHLKRLCGELAVVRPPKGTTSKILLIMVVCNRLLTRIYLPRPNIQLSCATDLGIYFRGSCAKRLPIMADIWTPNAVASMVVDREWQ